MKKISIFFLLLIFINQAYAVDDCQPGKNNLLTIYVSTTPAVIIPDPVLCKPLGITNFSVTKGFNSQDYSLNWSKQDHATWHVSSYDVRVNGEVTSYDDNIELPLVHSLAPESEGIANYEVRACINFNGAIACGDWVTTATQCETTCLENDLDFNVFEDQETSRRFVKWTKGDPGDYYRWGLTHYQLSLYKGSDLYERRSFPLDVELPIVLSDLEPNKYIFSACTQQQCGSYKSTSTIKQGLGRVHNPEVIWSNLTVSSPQNYKLKFSFDYPSSQVSTDVNGKPTKFKIVSDLIQPNGSFVLEEVAFNGQVSYTSSQFNYSDVIGNTFAILACNDYLGCGDLNSVTFGTPLSSNDLPIPNWVYFPSRFGDTLTMRWDFEGATQQQIDHVDYIEVHETQPITPSLGGNFKKFGSSVLQRVFYIDDLSGQFSFNRQAIGRYKYYIKACKRDREFGDVCSSESELKESFNCRKKYLGDTIQCSQQNAYQGVQVNLDTIENVNWYETSSGKKAIRWQYDMNKNFDGFGPDYFYLTLESGSVPNTSSCSGKNDLVIEYADNILENQKYTWSSEALCDDIGETEWKIEACFNGAGCIANTHIIVDSSTPPGAGPIITDPNDNMFNLGGPGQMRSGMWWHPELSGTGWHFYWANELRGQSDNPGQYKKTYDLIGYWFAYKEVKGTWTPVWFEARLKQDTLSQVNSNRLGYFEGNLLYRNGNTPNATNIDVGHIQLYFKDPNSGAFANNPKRAVLFIDADYSKGVFSRTDDLGPYELGRNGQLKLNIEDFNIYIMQGGNQYGNYAGRFRDENDADFYSGAWQLNPQENGFSELTMLTSIRRDFEVTTFAFYDSDGEPIWVQGSSCGGNNCGLPTAGQFEDYIGNNASPTELTMGLIPYGFNPLGRKPDWFNFGDPNQQLAMYVGRGGRKFDYGDPNDINRFNQATFWLDVDINLTYEFEDGETETRTIQKDFGTYTQVLEKTASLQGIGFEINNPETENEGLVCDPNSNASAECDIKFHWYSDKDFSTIYPTQAHAIIPKYSYREQPTGDWSDYEPLSQLCGGFSTNTYLVAGLQCLIHTPGEYRFQLHKNTYDTSDNSTFPMAESDVLKIVPCTQLQCQELLPLSSETPFTGSLPNPESNSHLVGTTAGEFQVDPSGQANYSIPIFAGAGTAGVTPTVALNYSSVAGNGHLGMGWTISGVSVITRCRETQESRDGDTEIIPKPLSFSLGDKFCLGGQRLFAVNGIYGENGTEYRTELDQFARIISYGGSNNNPNYFTVERKDGSTSYYGNTTDSNITVDFDNDGTADSTYAWSVNKYVDNMGNYIQYSYNNFGNMEFAINEISYTGNESQNLTPYNKIKFLYDNLRTDKYDGYVSGVKSKVTRRVTEIKSKIDGQQVRSYKPTYSYSAKSGRMRMDSIKECYDDNNCLKPTTFGWTNVNSGFTVEVSGDFHTTFPTITTSKTGDVNGDGRIDLVYVDQDDKFKIALAGGYGGFCTEEGCGVDKTNTISANGINKDKQWTLIDYNADGLLDLIYQKVNLDGEYELKIRLANYSTLPGSTDLVLGYTGIELPLGLTTDEFTDMEILDVNGDGLSDLLFIDNAQAEPGISAQTFSVKLLERVPDSSGNLISSYRFSTETYSVALPSTIDGIGQPGNGNYLAYRLTNGSFSDVNADGLVDLVLQVLEIESNNAQTSYVAINSTDDLSGLSFDIASSHIIAFESMGISDNSVIYNQIYQYIDTIQFTDLNNVQHSGEISALALDLKVSDINADGVSDVVYKSSTGEWKYKLGTGLDFLPAETIAITTSTEIKGKHLQLIDYNSDGFTDFMFPGADNQHQYQVTFWNGVAYVDDAVDVNTYASGTNSGLSENFNIFMDFDGDGRADHLRINNVGDQLVRLSMSNHIPVDRIETFTNGLDATTRVRYVPMTFNTLYEQGNHRTPLDWGNGSAVFDYQGTMFLVEYVFTPSPEQGFANAVNYMKYHYANARIQAGGRGFLGFGEITTMSPTQISTGAHSYFRTTTRYRQDFPYIGMAESSEVHLVSTELSSDDGCADINDCFPEPPCPPGQVCDPQGVDNVDNNVTVTLMSRTENLLEYKETHDHVFFPYVRRSFEYVYSPDSPEGSPQLLKRNEMWTEHDDYGNPLSNTTVVRDANLKEIQRKSQVNFYCNYPDPTNARGRCPANFEDDRWYIGLLRVSDEAIKLSKNDVVIDEVKTKAVFSYDYQKGLKSHSYSESNLTDQSLYLKTLHQYDNFGNEIKTITCSIDLGGNCLATPSPSDEANPLRVHRYSRMDYDNKGRYITVLYNSKDQKLSEITARDIYGNPTTVTDLLGRTTTKTYDVFGRLISSKNSIGEWSTVSRQWCTQLSGELACPSGMGLKVRTRALTAGGGEAYTYQDMIGREVYQVTNTFNENNMEGVSINERYTANKVWHDRFGRQITTQGPYFLGSTNGIPATSTEYDKFNRPTRVILADGSFETLSYEPFVVTKTNGLGQMKREKVNELGQLIMVKDFDVGTSESPQYQNKLTYTYNAQGLVSQIKRRTKDENSSDVIEMLSTSDYDIHGRKTSGSDVDTGDTSTIYNALGEVVQTTDAKGQVLNSYYDSLGRVYKTTSKDSAGNLLTSTTFTYDSVNGLLLDEDKVTYTGGLNLYYGVEHYYDTYNRASSSTVTFTDTDNLCDDGMNCVYEMAVYYDQYSRIKFQQDASGQAIQNHYNNHGFLSRITKPYVDSKEYYKIISTDHFGNIKGDRRGGENILAASYFYDAHRGWLTDIVSGVQNHHYEFDVLGNLQSRRKTGVISNETDQLECFSYDRLNRLTRTHRYDPDRVTPSTVCTDTNDIIQDDAVKYDGRGNITEKDNQLYSYLTASPSDVTVSPHQVQSKGAQEFGYDANGNNTSMTNFIDSSGAYRTRNISYTAFDKIKKVWTTDNGGNEIASSEYRYDIGENRFYRKDINEQNEASVTHFIGNVEINYPASGNKVMRRQLGNYAIIIENVGSQSIRYLFTDHLGSVDVITDGYANVLERMSFSAWGEKRLFTSWQTVLPSTQRLLDSRLTSRGFTGHEMNDAFGLVNMGGRIYDASLGRVLQADPFVQEPTVSQSYNRYSYVFNNPLSYTDPSGYISLRQGIGIVVGAVLTYYLGPLGANLASAAGAALIGGFVGAYISTDGNITASVQASFTAAVTAFVMDKMFSPKAGSELNAVDGGAGFVCEANPHVNSLPSSTTTTDSIAEYLNAQNSNQISSIMSENVANEFAPFKSVERFKDTYTLSSDEIKILREHIDSQAKLAREQSIRLKRPTSSIKDSLKKTMKLSNKATSDALSSKFNQIADYLDDLKVHQIGLLTESNFTDSLRALALESGGEIFISKTFLEGIKAGLDSNFVLIHEASHVIGGYHYMYDGVLSINTNIEQNFLNGTFDKLLKFDKMNSTYPKLISNPYNQTWYLKDRIVPGGFK